MRQEPEEVEAEAAEEGAADLQATPPAASADEQTAKDLTRVDSTLQGLGPEGGWGLPGGGKASAQFWEGLLKDRVQALKEEELAQMGRGRRVRCEVRYQEAVEDDWDRISQDEWRQSKSESASSDYEMDGESDGGVGRPGGKQGGRKRTVADIYGGGGGAGLGGGDTGRSRGAMNADVLAAAAVAAAAEASNRQRRRVGPAPQEQPQQQQHLYRAVLQPLPDEPAVDLVEGSGDGLKVVGFSREERQRFLEVVMQHGFLPAGPDPEEVWEHYIAVLPGKSVTQVRGDVAEKRVAGGGGGGGVAEVAGR
jgi:hypothetical protein